MTKWLVLFALLAACGDPSFPMRDPGSGFTPPQDRFPCARTVSPAQGRVGAEVTLTGEFGDAAPTVQFSAGTGSETAATVRSWSPTQVVVTVPALGFGSWSIALPFGCQLSNPPQFEVLAPPRVYINNNANGPDGFNTITTMIYDPDTGALTPMGPPISTGIPASGRPGCSDSLVLVHGSRLYASGDTGVAVFAVDGVTGGLKLTSQGSLFPPGLTAGAALRFSFGAYLWVATGAGVVAWRLDTGDHLVAPTVISAAPARTLQLFGDLPTQLYATRGDGTFDGWSVSYQADPTGFGVRIPVLTPLDGSPYGTSGAAVPDTGTQFVASRDPDDRLYVPTPAGLSLWAVDQGARSVIQRTDSPFALRPPSGTLGGPLLLGTARSRVLYMPAIGSGYIVGAALDATGAASAAAGSPWNFAPGVTNLSCMVAVAGATPGSVRLIASDAGNRRVGVFDLPAGGATPVPVAGSPFSMTYTPSELASGIAVLGAP